MILPHIIANIEDRRDTPLTGSTTEPAGSSVSGARFVGIDAGAETLKLVELVREGATLRVGRREIVEHRKTPGPVLLETLRRWDWENVSGAVVTGRFAGQTGIGRVPVKQAQLRGYRHLFGNEPATIVNIGSHGFSVLEVRPNGLTTFRENSRCSQGTGNFLCQLVERFSLSVEEASALCADVSDPAPLSGRCPVILKTDMTHLANRGEDRARILAGLFDAVCENVVVLIKPGKSPARVVLTGGVSRSPRIRRSLGKFLTSHQMEMLPLGEEDALFLDALGAAVLAAESREPVPPLAEVLQPPQQVKLERLPSLRDALARVKRMPAQPWAEVNGQARRVIIGFDVGSTGSKLVAMDVVTRETLWEGYRQTLGNPVGAAQDLLSRFVTALGAKCPVVGFGATGSGREVVGSLLTSCFGREAVFVVNEIVAHATGALHYDERVDTIFEIGGQDAKYIRLAGGRIIDSAMNEACSAGTGSFIEEQGRKFTGIEDVSQLGQEAVAADFGVSLGQHCSVFMAEVIDEAVLAGVEQPAIVSGLYDSIVMNYLNRVKGNRSVGKVIFCQGMPFSADALAAAVARQTGSDVVVPPNPGTVGALGIALLAARELDGSSLRSLEVSRFLKARVEQKDTFVCRSTAGCGGSGNRCRIDRIRTVVTDRRSSFTWGGGCSLYDKGARKRKLPDLAPDPFREREELLQRLIAPLRAARGMPRVALSDEFILKGLFPFFAAFLHDAGLDLELVADEGQATLKRGIQSATVPFCAPVQHFHGVAESMAATGADWLFVPMIRSMPRERGQRSSAVCPVAQASPDLLRWSIGSGAEARTLPDAAPGPRLLSPRIDFAEGNLESAEFLASCARLARLLRLSRRRWKRAWRAGVALQQAFDRACLEIGQKALEFCRTNQVVPVVVLGRSYTIYNKVLNSNVPAILREQGAMGIPVDCYPIGESTPLFPDMYWGFGQNILRAAHQVRRTPGVYALYSSNYSCGPDSFNLHFTAYVMEGKPFAVIETDGHSGDAGTKTRVEAFLHCVDEDRRLAAGRSVLNEVQAIEGIGPRPGAGNERLLIPYMGPCSESVAAVFRGTGLTVETLPPPDEESLRLGRRYTSGKECLPMPLTLGSLLQRLSRAGEEEHFVYLMTSTDGPCRFGVYNMLNQIVLERLGWRDRVRIWAPKDTGYFDDMPAGTEMLVFTGILASEALYQALLDVRPVERQCGEAERLFEHQYAQLVERLEKAAAGDLSLASSLREVIGGRLFGIAGLLAKAGEEFAALRGPGERPLVELNGEIYVRAVGPSNDRIIEKLEERGLRVHLSPTSEWINYCSHTRQAQGGRSRLADRFSDVVRRRIQTIALGTMARLLGWDPPPPPLDSLAAARPYLNDALEGEAVLTLGVPLAKWRRGAIDAVVSVGPLECMPSKIAEAQFHHAAEREGLLSLNLAFNGDPITTSALDNFAYEVNDRFHRRRHTAKERNSRTPGELFHPGDPGKTRVPNSSPVTQ